MRGDGGVSEVIVEELSFQYNRSPEPNLKEIVLEAGKGEVIGILGVTGAGKTTPMRTFNGLIPQFFEGKISGKVRVQEDRKSTRLNSSHVRISYAVFCLKKKITPERHPHDAGPIANIYLIHSFPPIIEGNTLLQDLTHLCQHHIIPGDLILLSADLNSDA